MTLESNRELPGFGPTGLCVNPDISVEFGPLPPVAREAPGTSPWYVSPFRDAWQRPPMTASLAGGDRYFHLVYHDRVEFLMDRSGSRIWASAPETTTLGTVVSYLLGPILAFALRLRHFLCLHASAVAIDQHAVLFLGRSQSGKSTIASWLAAKGHRVLADDVVAIEGGNSPLTVRPAYPWLRLQQSTAEALRHLLSPAPNLTRLWDDDYLDLALDQPGYRFQDVPLPLGAVYVIDRTDLPALQDPEGTPHEMSPARALVALLAGSWGSGIVDRSLRAEEFDGFARIATTVPVRRLSWNGQFAELDDVCRGVIGSAAIGQAS